MRAAANHLATRFGSGLLRLVMPPLCLSCRSPVAETGALCAPCWMKLSFIELPVCDRLGSPFPYDEGEGAVSAAAIAEPPLWDRARGAVVFDDVSRRLIHALKYHDRHEAGLVMARLMTRAGAEILAGAEAIVPVPLYRWRLWRRRYNQSAILARQIAELSGHRFRPELLDRVRPTRQQAGLDSEARRRHVSRAFKVAERMRSEVAARSIVIVDDVLTTGATAGACAQALKAAGAGRVDVLAFALVQQPRRFHI